MKNSKRIMSALILFALAIIGVSAQAQRQSSRVSTRQVGGILQRLEQSSNRFRDSLNDGLISDRIDETRPQNDINSFEPAFASAIDQFRDRFTRRRAVAADVQNILQKASLVNGFMTRNRLNVQVQNDWASVRTDLNALANAYGVSWQWNRQTLPPVNPSRSSRLSDSELNQLIQRIETGGDTFRSSLTGAFGQGRYDQTTSEVNMNDAVRDFKNATDQLRNRFDARQSVTGDVEHLLEHATPIDTYMHNNRLTNRAQNDWSTLRGDLNTLAGAYNLSANWQNGAAPPAAYNSNSRLTGTYRLDSSRSDKPRDVADRATRNLSNNERQGISDRMLARLESPEMLAIERRGSTMTMASSRAQQSTFEADGVERQEQLSNGRSSRVTATLRGDQLGVSSTGYRENDFNVTFEPIENGGRLRVRREIYSDRLSQPIVVNSIYDRTSNAAQWNIYDGPASVPGNSGATSGEFIVRDGDTVVAVLNNDLTTKQAKQGDRFTMTVRDSGQYEGAVIEGTVGSVNQGGRLTGRSGMSLNFDTIRLRNGQTYRFAGILTSVRTSNNDTVKVDNEGSAQGDNQTTQTLERAGIGTAIGAIIGAIAGGGKGAAIGGVIGAAGGAGSVYVTGKDNLELPSGTELTIRSSAPGR
ncbi:MAG TPA: hypothetical protein VHE60_14835 [Pyrinomonadaceae bacterium]|nr:hypothetical protein [Pyrinomonadaceae bacterium]